MSGLPELSSSKRKLQSVRKESSKNPNGFPNGSRDGYGMGMGSGKKNPYRLPCVPDGLVVDADGKKAWATVLGELERVVNRHMFLLWVEPMRFAGVANESVVITGDYRRSRWVAVRYGRLIGDVCRGLGFRGALICEEGS